MSFEKSSTKNDGISPKGEWGIGILSVSELLSCAQIGHTNYDVHMV